jgi:hypothetical protein
VKTGANELDASRLETYLDVANLTGAIRIPHTVTQLEVTADLRTGNAICHVDVAAPRDGRAATRVNWLVRQLKNAPETVRVEAFTAHSRGASSAELLRDIRENPAILVTDPTKELRMFRVALDRPLGAKLDGPRQLHRLGPRRRRRVQRPRTASGTAWSVSISADVRSAA